MHAHTTSTSVEKLSTLKEQPRELTVVSHFVLPETDSYSFHEIRHNKKYVLLPHRLIYTEIHPAC